MKAKLSLAALTMVLALSGAGFAAPAKHKVKYSAAHKAAIKQCDADYKTAEKEAHMKKGKERKEAEAAASQARKQCIAAAPK
jgi:uncharacterized protein HemX